MVPSSSSVSSGPRGAHGGVGRGYGHVAPVVQVQAEVVDLRPALLDPVQALLDFGRGAVAHGVAHGHAADINAHLVPHVVFLFQQGHQAVHRELAEEVGTPTGVAADARLLDVQFLGLGHALRPGFHFLHLRAVGVAAGEHVAHVGREPGVRVALDGQGRRVLPGALHAAGIQGQRGVGDAGLGGETGDNLVNALHLRRPLGADERADDDVFQAAAGKLVKQFDLVVNGYVGVLDLHAFAHAFLFVDYLRVAGHLGLLNGRVCDFQPSKRAAHRPPMCCDCRVARRRLSIA